MKRRRQGTRDRLVEIARDLYLEKGPEDLSLREVARRAGVSAPAVYRHFASKDALIAAVCEEGFRIFSTYLMGALSEEGPLKRMQASRDAYLRFATENKQDYRVIFMSDSPRPTQKKSEPAPTFRFLVDRVSECMLAGVIAKGDADEIAAVIWAHVHGLVSLRLSGHLANVGSDAAFARFYRHATDRLIAGLGNS